jgi:hypothetical protein
MPKSAGNPYFEDCHRGAEEAARELGFTLRWDGPPEPDAARQARIVERWAREGLPAFAVSVESPPHLTPALKDARFDSVVFWKTRDLGYLAAASAHAAATGALEPGAASLRAGRLGNVIVRGDEIRLGRCHIVTKGNLDSFR